MHNLFDLRDAAFFAGLVAVCAGLGAYDWRWAAIAGGVVLLGVALAPALRKGE
jgi:hypothetical protein